MSEQVRLDIGASIATITLDSPATRNALSTGLMEDLRVLLDRTGNDGDVRAVVLTGTGTTFCAGAAMGSSMEKYPAAVGSLLWDMWTYEKPLVAVVDGHVRGGGIGMLAAADIVITSEKATFSFSEVRLGLVPTMVAVLCKRRMSPRSVSRYFLTGEIFHAPEAELTGLVTAGAESAHLDEDVRAFTEALKLGEPEALRGTKRFIEELSQLDVESGIAHAREVAEALVGMAAAEEGMRAYLEKRPPSWAVPTA